MFLFFFSSRRRHTRSKRDWSSDVCSSDEDFDTPGEEIFCAYALSASVYGYAAEIGVDPFELARRARSSGASLAEVSRQLDGPALTEDGWSNWVVSTYG